jgi:acetylornithine deacetylase/succinyl-diaminopimelate desuccinylase-like protein
MRAVWLLIVCGLCGLAQTRQPDWSKLQEETMRHFQTLVRANTASPPGNEIRAVEYLQKVLESEGIPVKTFATEPSRPNLVARIKGSGKKRPLLIMGHTDVVTVDEKKWKFPPFSATRDGGYIYGRGTTDDKDNLTACLMIMLQLKRLNVPLDRDVIFLAEAGEESATVVGIDFMVNNHFAEIDAEYALAEGGGIRRQGGKAVYGMVGTAEKVPVAVTLTARGPAGHGSVPLRTNAVVHLAQAVTKVAAWQPPMRLNDTTRTYFERLAGISSPEDAARYRGIVDKEKTAAIQEYFAVNEPAHNSMLRTSISPNIIQGGYRFNVIPSEAEVRLDVRALPDENMETLLAELKNVIGDPAIEIKTVPGARKAGTPSPVSNEAFKAVEDAIKKHYGVVTLPSMSTGATDKAQLRVKGIASYGIGSATDVEDGPLGFGAHSDQERILETELHRFVQMHWDVVLSLAGTGRN